MIETQLVLLTSVNQLYMTKKYLLLKNKASKLEIQNGRQRF